MLHQEATYKIIRHRRVTPRPPPLASANRRKVHLNRNPGCIVDSLFSLLFPFSTGRSVAGPPRVPVCPTSCANIRNRNMNIPSSPLHSPFIPPSSPRSGLGCVVRDISPPLLGHSLLLYGTNPLLRGCMLHVCRYSRVHLFTCIWGIGHSSSTLFLSRWGIIGKRAKKKVLGALSIVSRILKDVCLWNPKRIDSLCADEDRGNVV